MMKRINIILSVLCAVSLLLCAAACGQGQEGDDIGGIPVTPEMLESVSRSLAEIGVAEPQTSSIVSDQTTKASSSTINTVAQTEMTSVAASEVTTTTAYDTAVSTVTDAMTITTSTEVTESSVPAVDTTGFSDMVYWTEKGTVYHLSASCTSLRNSVKIFQGSVADALLAEKERACKLCS